MLMMDSNDGVDIEPILESVEIDILAKKSYTVVNFIVMNV